MKIDIVEVGMLETNVYILEKNSEVIVIDPGDEIEKIKPLVEKYKVVGIIITHYHFDHIGALEDLEKFSKAKIYDYKNLKEGLNKIGEFEFKVIYTPGHKEDSICLYFEKEKTMFSGDFIFKGTVGRWDLEGGSIISMKKSIEKILTYPDDIKLYPGHGATTVLGYEKENLSNYLKCF